MKNIDLKRNIDLIDITEEVGVPEDCCLVVEAGHFSGTSDVGVVSIRSNSPPKEVKYAVMLGTPVSYITEKLISKDASDKTTFRDLNIAARLEVRSSLIGSFMSDLAKNHGLDPLTIEI
jgi:hypothetical protein